jgi:hypothetical protein
MTTVQDFKGRLELCMFHGETLRNVENSLYRIGNERFVIAATKPKSKGYFFGINARYVEQADFVVLVCGNDLAAFKIPVAFFKELNFNYKEGRYLPTVTYFEKTDDWYISIASEEGHDSAKILISPYFISLKKDEEVINTAMALKERLGLIL